MSCPFPPAYIDPFSGTILLQVIVAGVIGCVAYFRRVLWRVARVAFRVKRPEDAPCETTPDEPEG